MERELVELRAMRPLAIAGLQSEKAALVLAYEKALEAVKQQPNALRALPPKLKNALSEAAQSFQSSLTENLRALNAVKIANERVHAAILRSVEQGRGPMAEAYGANRGKAPRRAAGALSIAYDRRL